MIPYPQGFFIVVYNSPSDDPHELFNAITKIKILEFFSYLQVRRHNSNR
jgi:hypothetical protein